jgi:ATP-dependent exoDNAse (exonuclease V) alpha subunit
VQRGLATELQENRRQVQQWERGALELVREGHAESALSLYEAQGRIHVGTTEDDMREQVVRAWRSAGDLDEAVMIARRRDDVADLNARARRHLRAAGALGDVELAAPGGAFAVGDRVVVKLNDFRLGVHNGDRGEVVAVQPHSLAVELRGRTVRLDAHFLTDRTAQGDPTLVHGYAITGHVAQGLTVDRAFVLADDGMNREWAYTALSRGRLSNHLYVASEPGGARDEFAPGEVPRDPLERLTAALKRSDESQLAIDQHPQRAETRHAALRFVDVDQMERRAAASWDRIAERRAQRERGQGLER